MSSVYDYTFHKSSRIGQDECDKSQDNIQNMASSTYMLDRFIPTSPTSNFVDFATSQLNMNFKGGYQVDAGGSNIDTNSALFHGALSKPKCKISLIERPFATVPYLGRGKRNIVTESQILQGNNQVNRKSVNPSSEISYLGYSQTPLVPSLKSSISNPKNLVEGVADKTWVRGGVASREYARTNDYVNTHN